MRIGIDAGVGSIKMVCLDGDKIETEIRETEGKPFEKISDILRKIQGKHSVGITGVEGKGLAAIAGIGYVNHALAVKQGFEFFYPDARTVFDIGKENSNYYLFSCENGQLVLYDFSTNSLCGAGGGALIEKMARRLEFLSLDDFVDKAESSERVANIAGRCGVFAESDVVHHYQKGSLPESIASGLCQMLAKNFQVNVLQGKKIIPPVYMIGGVSKNKAVVKFLEELIGQEIVIPDNQEIVKAFGAAQNSSEIDLQETTERFDRYKKEPRASVSVIKMGKSRSDARGYEILEEIGEDKIILSLNEDYKFNTQLSCYLGLDVGSVSTKAAVIDKTGRFVFGIYKRTGGKPIDAVVDVIRRTGDFMKQRGLEVVVLGAGVTGSGRDVAGKIIGADVVRNEITAQAQGARFFVPQVDTVFEIGGQDSKYIYLENAMVVDNEMNKACAASTGSFLEEQAKILRINIEQEFATLALQSRNPCSLSEKCAILMASSLAHYQDSPIEDKCAGLAYSVCYNYLNRVVGKKPTGKNIVFQGAVAFNNAVVAGFETLLGKKIYVPGFPHLTGAIGIANIVREEYEKGERK